MELDITFPPEMTHGETHDIGAALRERLEASDDVSRAFIHLGRPSESDAVSREVTPDEPLLAKEKSRHHDVKKDWR